MDLWVLGYRSRGIAVKADPQVEPWQPIPYDHQPVDLRTIDEQVEPGGATYDAANRIIYVAQRKADPDGFGFRPIIHAFRVNTPTSASTVTSLTVSSDPASPQATNATISFTAAATGGATPIQYKWSVYDGATWSVTSDWGASSQFAWTPTSAGSGYKVRAWARSAGNGVDQPEASAEVSYTINGNGIASAISITADKTAPQPAGTPVFWTASVTGGTGPLQYKGYAIKAWVRSASNASNTPEAQTEHPFPTTGPGPATDISLSTSHASPQQVGTTITWTATPTGGVPQHQYKWLTLEANGWVLAKDWSTENTFAWTPNTVNQNHKVAVWVRSAGNTNDGAPSPVRASNYPHSLLICSASASARPFGRGLADNSPDSAAAFLSSRATRLARCNSVI